MTSAQLQAYLARIEHGVPGPPALATLNSLIAAHVRAIPFENLDVLAGIPIRLEHQALFEKLVVRGRGGYCFEQNGLFEQVLLALGFRVRSRAARARVGRARFETPPRTHLALEVEVEGGSWLVDVGIGGLTPTQALRLTPDEVQATAQEARRLVCIDGCWWHQAYLDEVWVDVCELTGESMGPIDREVASWYTSTHPDSPFAQGRMVARVLPDGGRATLAGSRLTVRRAGGLERVELGEHEIEEALEQVFGLARSAVP